MNRQFSHLVILLGLVATRLCPANPPVDPAQEYDPVHFQKIVLNDRYYCDGVTAADINADGHIDIVAGPFWYEGPSFQNRYEFYEAVALPPAESPSNSLFSFVHDFNNDGRNDILVAGRTPAGERVVQLLVSR